MSRDPGDHSVGVVQRFGVRRRGPPHNDDALLRWNTCVRVLARNPYLKPAVEEHREPILSE